LKGISEGVLASIEEGLNFLKEAADVEPGDYPVILSPEAAGVFAQSRVIPDDAFHFLATTQEEFDLALLDPPYHHGTVAKALPQLAAHMAPGGVVLCETELDAELPEQVEGLVLAKQYKYGKILVSRYEKEEQL